MFAMKLSKFVEFTSTKVESDNKRWQEKTRNKIKKIFKVQSLALSPGVKKRSLKVTPLPFFYNILF